MKRVLCYGDSLTAGYFRYGFEYHPYADTIGNLCALHGGRDTVQVDAVGMSGWTTSEMVKNIENKRCADVTGEESDGLGILLRNQQSYDVVCLMAGTNDVGTLIETDTTIHNLKALVDTCLSINTGSGPTSVVVLSIPGMGVERNSNTIHKLRTKLNEQIKELVQSYAKKTEDKLQQQVYFIDAYTALPNPSGRDLPVTQEGTTAKGSDGGGGGSNAGNLSDEDLSLWDQDLLHLSPQGSQTLGEFVHTQLVAFHLL